MIKTKMQLLDEITELRRKIKAFEKALTGSPETDQALRQSEEFYRVLVENASEAVLVIQNEKIRYVNKKASEITGYSARELSSRSSTTMTAGISAGKGQSSL